jgi:hypothetical protein
MGYQFTRAGNLGEGNVNHLIKGKETKLDVKEVETTVKSSVESNVKEQFKLYSKTVAENVMVCQPD